MRRPSGFVPFGGLARRQEILSYFIGTLWLEIETHWVPTARPIEPTHLDNTGDYSRRTLGEVLCKLDEWDGFEVCAMLTTFYGWRADARLVQIIHSWSCSLYGKIKTMGRSGR